MLLHSYPNPRRKRSVGCSVYYQTQLPTSCKGLLLHTTSNKMQIWINTAIVLTQTCRHPKYSSFIIGNCDNAIIKATLLLAAFSIPPINTARPKASAMHKFRWIKRWLNFLSLVLMEWNVMYENSIYLSNLLINCITQ